MFHAKMMVASYQAEFWQQNLEWEYGQPVIKRMIKEPNVTGIGE